MGSPWNASVLSRIASVGLFVAVLAVSVSVQVAASARSTPATGARTAITIEGDRPGPAFQGIGAISGGGGNSRLLIDYPAPERRAILDYLFRPHFGASLQMFKLEIGGDANSTDGAEPSIEHAAGRIDCRVGYEFWLAKQALARNPEIKLYGLQWAAPAWVSDGPGLWSQADVKYIIDWLRCARSEGLPISYVGGWNEHYVTGASYEITWYESLRRALDRCGFRMTQIVAADQNVGGPVAGNWSVAGDMAANPSFDRAVAVIGAHDTCGHPTTGYECESSASARTLSARQGKPLWESELGQTPAAGNDPALAGPGGLARSLVSAYVQARVTGIILWPMMDAMTQELPLGDRGLITADYPWDGSYKVNPLTWVIAQTTQFTTPGWRFVKGANGSLACGCDGSFVTYEAPNRRAWSMVVQTSVATAAQSITVHVTGGLPAGVVYVWSTNLHGSGAFVRRRDIEPNRGTFTADLLPGYVYTFTTTTGQSKAGGRHQPDGRAGPMPLPYVAAPDGAGMADMLAPMEGSFEYVDGELTQTAVGEPREFQPVGSPATPYAVVGGSTWRNYTVSATVVLPPGGGASTGAMLVSRFGGYVITGGTCRFLGYELTVDIGGAWRIIRNGRSPVVLASGSVAASGVYHLSLTVEGSLISAAIAGPTVASVSDTTYTDGPAGIGALGYYPVRYDGFAVYR